MNIEKIIIERLILRKWTLDDVDALVDGLSDFNTAKNLTVPYPYTIEHAKSFITNSLNKEKYYPFAIVLKENNKVIGGTGIEFDTNLQIYKGGIWLNKNYTGKGYGTEVWKARAKYMFENLNLEEIINGYFDFNDASKHMQEKVGYKIIDKKMTYCPALQKEVVEIVTRLTKKDFYNKFKNT